MSLLVPIKRSTPFDPSNFYFKDCRIKRQDLESLLIDSLDLEELRFSQPWWENKNGANRSIHLDGQIFETLWERVNTGNNETGAHKIPQLWNRLPAWWERLTPTGYSFFQFYFDGIEMENKYGVSYVPFMRWTNYDWNKENSPRWWKWGYTPINYDWGYKFPALVLPR